MITYEDKVALNENSEIAEKNKITADNMNEIKAVVNGLANSFFPIGKIEIFFDSNDHSNYLGFTWERTLIGKMPIGYDRNEDNFKTIGATGGEKEHTLTIAEMPSHEHLLIANTNTYSSPGSKYYHLPSAIEGYASGDEVNIFTNSSRTNTSGGGQPHNNMPPYQVVSFWKRVS